jgi:ribosome-associated protein
MTARPTASKRRFTPRQIARRAAKLALEKKASQPVVIDLRQFGYVCDWYVVASGESEPQVKAIAEGIEAGLSTIGEKPWHVEGKGEKHWILLDYVDVVVHVFHSRVRENYMLERLWGDAPRETFEDAGPDGS